MNSVWTLGDWLQYLFSFIFVIGLLLSLLWTLRKLQNGSSLLRKSTARLQALETLSVGPRQKIMLVRVDEREILVGITAQQMTVLTPWPATPAMPAAPEASVPTTETAHP
ncbi:flagellar biosynthetic protein FliO [Limnohabitans sp. T6-20]|uniref:flagellar biosynthetic protein FliO n=1 Tax=Limnohabitans sp. T6-20 TaxID=1100725 RepID=UPI000D38EC1A|nr:flagellar biosynthetic protein FliO [Limnohabitans sp. T6-20]PUE10237.1 flagellar biosynthetic protein FliO [Limnohabitans sp. T6-20]